MVRLEGYVAELWMVIAVREPASWGRVGVRCGVSKACTAIRSL